MGQTPDSVYYGGVSYGGNEKAPDLSNLQWSLEALVQQPWMNDKSLTPEQRELREQTSEFFNNAIRFLERTQNLKKFNDQSYSADDGGFMYRPGESKAGETRSYGGMTYAGMKSFIYAGVSRDDERVQAAYNWLRKNYTVTENPGIGRQGLFYYYHSMAKALDAYGDDVIVDMENKKHDWREDLAGQLLKIQSSGGFWVNDNARWWENNPVLVTAYVVLALEEIAGLPHSLSRKQLLIK
jgi:squalene-hopene/tetraprenyl-beta-curcumene cyclase